jgi:hypothetical protein
MKAEVNLHHRFFYGSGGAGAFSAAEWVWELCDTEFMEWFDVKLSDSLLLVLDTRYHEDAYQIRRSGQDFIRVRGFRCQILVDEEFAEFVDEVAKRSERGYASVWVEVGP